MICLDCMRDCTYKERQVTSSCPNCGRRFVFEPRTGDGLTDAAFHNAFLRASSNGAVRFTRRHLEHQLAKPLAKKSRKVQGGFAAALTLGGSLLAVAGGVPALALLPAVAAAYGAYRLFRRPHPCFVALQAGSLSDPIDRWERAHGPLPGLIRRKEPGGGPFRAPPPDLAHYSFDRAVICDLAETVDLLLANNFHFENNCAVLSVDGYPPDAFGLVREMIRNNPRLKVFALHDASIEGCTLAHRLATDRAWFKGRVPVIDVGMRPGNARRFRGAYNFSPDNKLAAQPGISGEEAKWLSLYSLELAALRPEQILKRLFRAVNKPDAPPPAAARDDRTAGVDGGGGGGGSVVTTDHDSFTSDAGAIDASADSFG